MVLASTDTGKGGTVPEDAGTAPKDQAGTKLAVETGFLF